MAENLNLVVNGDDENKEHLIQVPIKKKDFGDFVTNLLGQPEAIIDNNRCLFEASIEWLIHIHHMLEQRIAQQATSQLVDFSCTFRYKNGLSRKITTLDGFLQFNEGKLVETKSVEIIWTYLINFPNKPTPEKQEIYLKLVSTADEVVNFRNGPIKRVSTNRGLISYKILHTERTWGDDIQTILSREIESILIEEKKYNKIIDTLVPLLALGIFIAGLFIPEYIDELIKSKQVSEIYANYITDSGNVENLSIDNKLDLTLALLNPSNDIHTVSILYRALSFFGGMFLAVFAVICLEDSRVSSIVITNEDRKRQTVENKKHIKTIIKGTFSIVAAVSAGVIANYCYYYLNL